MEIGGCERALVAEQTSSVYAAGTAYKYLGIVFRVKVKEYRAGKHAVAQVVGAGKAGFFIYREECFHRAVYKIFVYHYGQRRCHADAVVGSEGGTVSAKPFTVYNSADRLGGEVEALVVALAHHVHVRLEYYSRSIFFAGCGGLVHNHIANGVCLDFYIVLGGKVKQILTNLLFLFGRAGYLVDFVENRENKGRLKVFDCHVAVSCI